MIEFDFQFDGQNHSGGAFYLSKLATFDKLQEGDPVPPLKVLRFDPSVHKVRERRLANILKGGREPPQMPSLVPEGGAEIGQLA